MYDEWRATQQTAHLLHALALLQDGIAGSPSNFYFKLAAVHIYHLLGELIAEGWGVGEELA